MARRGKRARIKRSHSKKVAIELPEPLYQQTEAVLTELNMNRSALVRLAVETFIREHTRKKLENELREGYVANAKLASEMAEEMMGAEADFD